MAESRLYVPLNPLYSGNPYRINFANSEDPGEMQLNAAFIRVYTVLYCISSGSPLFAKVKISFRKKKTLFFQNYSPTPLARYVQWTIPSLLKQLEGKIH